MAKFVTASIAATLSPDEIATNRRNLFLVGFLILFLELACIRWFGSYVLFLQFFTNIILIACFLGMSIGCVCAAQRTDWLKRFPWLALGATGLAIGLNLSYRFWEGLAIDVGSQRSSPQMVFFGTEYRAVDLAQFVVPVELIAAVFFVLVTLMFIGPGQVLGRCFDKDPNRVLAYASNIGGSLAGILGFAIVSFLNTPPIVWFLIGFLGLAYLLQQEKQLKRLPAIVLCITALLILVTGFSPFQKYRFFWSPYYWIVYNQQKREIHVNGTSHQIMLPFDRGPIYSLIHMLQRGAGGPSFERALIIGAGSGNDVAHTLRRGVQQVDAVEIDPVIQQLGAQYHPERPYDDARVRVHLDDGRNFLHRSGRQYDLIIYALVDSLILHSSYSNIRLESFLFTEQAFRDVKKVLAPDGVFVTYNYFRQGWIVHRIAHLLEKVFGEKPLVISLPFIEEVRADDERLLSRFTMVIAGNTSRIADAFKKHNAFWLNRKTSLNDGISGFALQPPRDLKDDGGQWEKIAPSTIPTLSEPLALSTDDWPFLYLRSPMIPWLSLRGAILIGGLGLLVLYWLAPGHRLALNSRMFFLGAAFLLLETKAVVHLALVFGSTWVVNSLVFAGILVMILAANLYVLYARDVQLWLHYAALFIALALNAVVPLDIFLVDNPFWRYGGSIVLVMAPMFFAGVVFAVSFRASTNAATDFGANIAGAVVGGFAEYLSMMLGFRYLMFVAIAFYMLSAAFGTAKNIKG